MPVGFLLAAALFLFRQPTNEGLEPPLDHATANPSRLDELLAKEATSERTEAGTGDVSDNSHFDSLFGNASGASPASFGKQGVPSPNAKDSTAHADADRDPSLAPSLPLPAHGIIRIYTAKGRVAPLRIVTPAGFDNYFVKLVDASTSRPVMSLFVRGGKTLETRVPLGSMRIRYATGFTWQGEKALFGPETQYREADKIFDFERNAAGVTGYTVELIKRLDGNLHTSSIDPSQF